MNPSSRPITREDVRQYLSEFHQKREVYGLYFKSDNRLKNLQALASLDITSKQRTEIIKEITVEDFSHGPLPNNQDNDGDLMVFGKLVKGTEVYIKISIGSFNRPVVCISFHPSSHNLHYPFKNLT